MGQDFLGVGWSTVRHVEEGGDDGRSSLALSRFEDNIRESIVTILSTAPGERQMRPDFGCDIHSLVFAPNDTTTAGRAAFFAEQALKRWEPRIEVQRVEARPEALEGSVPPIGVLRRKSGEDRQAGDRLLVEIEYEVIATNTIFNLVYPFYLTEGIGG